MPVLTLPSPAKLNLFLHINGRLPNGYHELQTLFQFLNHSDTMSFETRNDGDIVLHSNIQGVAAEDNLVVKAARLLQQQSATSGGMTITLEKRLPMGGGIGGGSSNAATTLLACNQLWQLSFSDEALAQLGLSLGADVPVFVHGKACVAEGVGEKFSDVNPNEPWYLVLHPDVHVSTAEIFSDPNLPRNTPKIALKQVMATNWHNDCENLVRKRHPQVENALSWLVEYAPSRMTGTGSCVFAAFESQAQANQALQNKPQSLTGFVAKGCNLSPLHQALSAL